ASRGVQLAVGVEGPVASLNRYGDSYGSAAGIRDGHIQRLKITAGDEVNSVGLELEFVMVRGDIDGHVDGGIAAVAVPGENTDVVRIDRKLIDDVSGRPRAKVVPTAILPLR